MDLKEIRTQIDDVDKEIRGLFIRRMELAGEVARIKAETEDDIYKPEREHSILQQRSAGMSDDLAMEYRALLRRTMEISRKYQYGLTLKLRDCFPFPYETAEPPSDCTGILRDELFLVMKDMQEDRKCFQAFTTYAEMGAALKAHLIDAGMGVIEKIGKDVCEELTAMLLMNGLFINACEVLKDEGEKLKVVTFTKKLVFKPEHNRVRIAFITPNRSGALGSILSMISDYGVNLTEIHSSPFLMNGEEEESWNYRFCLEMEMNALQETSKALLFQLYSETQQFTLLGSYLCEGDFV